MSEGIVQGYRLSPQQKHLWLLRQHADGPIFLSRCAVKIEGRLNAEMLEKAIYRVVEEHEILRTTFPLLPGMMLPLQVIHQESAGCVKWHDLRLLSADEQRERVSSLYSATADLPPQCDVLPLFCCDLLQLSPDETVMVAKAPAICADLRSLENIVTQVASCYESDAATEIRPIDSMQYADFAEWHHELLEADEGQPAREHWTSRLRQTEITLPFENRVAAETLFQPKLLRIELSADDARQNWSRVALACWQILIQRLAGSSDVTLGIAFNGRRDPELKNSVGLYSHYVPLDCASGDEQFTIKQLCEHLARAEDEAAQWQEYFAWPDDSAESPAYFSVCFEERRSQPVLRAGGITFSIYQQHAIEDRFKLKLVCVLTGEEPRLELHYDASRFTSEDIRRTAGELATLIANASRNETAPIDQLENLSSAERVRIVEGFNQTTEIFPIDCIQKLFEAQVRQSPDTVAVVCGSVKATYAQLNQRANQLAHYLQKLGIGPDVPVGLHLERSVDFVVGMLGILKAGGAYLPFDVNTPEERLAAMLTDTRVPVLISRPGQEKLNGCRTLSLHADELLSEDTDDCTSETTVANLAYVIFTSGSTGKPKGVAVEHRQLCNYVHAINRKMGLSSCRTFAIVSTLVADLAHTTLFTSLLSGGTLHLIPEDEAANPVALAGYFKQHQVECLKIVPTHLNALLASAHASEILPVQHLILGGEACSSTLLEKIWEFSSGVTVWNHYGPTETTVGCVAQQLTSEDSHSSIIAIGRPLPNQTAYVVDEHLRPLSIGVTGELYVGGAGVARGYLNRPELTAERFVPDPFSKAEGNRLYRTGDRARYLSDGRIELLGRVDHQLKVRGYRIEPEEIQIALNEHPLVSQSVVVGREDRPTDKRLVAYVVVQGFTNPAAKDLREFLEQRLPDYMVPSTFVFLKTLPVTANGKIDRKALPPPKPGPQEKQFIAASTPVEVELSRIWAAVLGLELVGIADNFFQLGGDSILAIQIIARANQAGMNLEPRQIFQHQTIAELAAVATTGLRPEAEQGMITGAVPMLPVQARFFKLGLPDPHHYNQARLLELCKPINPQLLHGAVQYLLLHHDALRLRFFRSGEEWKQINSEPGSSAPFERIDIRKDKPEIQEILKWEAARLHTSLNLHDGPIIRVALFDGGDESASYILIVIHHLAVDTVSWSVLVEDLETAYLQLAAGRQISLPRKTSSFKSWAENLAHFARSGTIEQEVDYWRSRLALPIVKLPIDLRGPNTVASRRTISVSLTAAETRAVLQDLPTKHRTQINEVLLAATTRTFTAWMGTPALLVDLEGHGREQIIEETDLSRTVGWFTTIFPVLLDTGKLLTPLEVLRAVKDQLRAVPNRGIGYGLLRHLSGRKEVIDELSRLPQAEVRFNYLGQRDRFLSSSQIFSAVHDSGADAQSLNGERAYLLNIIAGVTDGQLRFDWTYSENVHASQTIQRLAETCLTELRALLKDGERSDSAYAPSDFPKAKLTQTDLNAIVAKLRRH